MRIHGNIIFIICVCFMSCNLSKRIEGTYVVENNPVVGIRLTLNGDGSFVEYIDPKDCQPKWFFGFYTIRRKELSLTQISGDLSYLQKRDTIIYSKLPPVEEKVLYLYYNQQKPLPEVMIFAEGERFLGKTNQDGSLLLPANFKSDSIVIKTGVHAPKRLKVKEEDFSQMFVMIYDYTFENCANFNFEKRYQVTKSGLLFYPDWERREKPRQVYLRKK